MTRIFERVPEYPLDRLVESGDSAYRIYLTERYGEETAQLALGIEADELEIVDDDDNEATVGSEESKSQDVEGVVIPEYLEIREEIETTGRSASSKNQDDRTRQPGRIAKFGRARITL